MHEQPGPLATATVASQGSVSPVNTSLRPGRGSPITSCGLDHPPAGLDRLSALQAPELRPRGDPQPRARSGSKRPGRIVLDQRVAERLEPVHGRVGTDPEAVDATSSLGSSSPSRTS